MTLMVRGYSRNRPIVKKGEYTGKMTYRAPPDGCRLLSEPCFTICAAGTLELWFIPEGAK